MATKKDLQNEVKRLNQKYCKNTKNCLVVDGAYGGYSIGLVGKRDKRFKKYFKRVKGSIPGMATVGVYGYESASKTLAKLNKVESSGRLKRDIKFYEKY